MTEMTPEQVVEHVCDVSAGTLFLTLTGFDEIAISRAFGSPIEELRPRPFMFLRACAFVHQRRGGAKDAVAHKTVMDLSVQALGDYFPDDPDELDDDDPEGKASGR